MPKSNTRQRPVIQANRTYIEREEYRRCQRAGCPNVIAMWANHIFCSRCRAKRKDRR